MAYLPLFGLIRYFAPVALAVHGDLFELECFRKRNLLGVVAGKSRLEFGDHALPELLRAGRTDPLHERPQQPAAHAPGHAEAAVEDGRAGCTVKTGAVGSLRW